MAKRLTDTRIWDKAWFRTLSPRLKESWRYLCDKCDHAGIWDIDMDALVFNVGEEVSLDELLVNFETKLIDSGSKLFIKGFVEFQYKCSIDSLNPKNKVHVSVQKRLLKFGLIEPLPSPLQAPCENQTSPLQRAKDKEEEKDSIKLGGVGEVLPPERRGLTATEKQQLSFNPEVQELKTKTKEKFGNRLAVIAPEIINHWGSFANFYEWLVGIEASFIRAPKDVGLVSWIEICAKKELGMLDAKRAQ